MKTTTLVLLALISASLMSCKKDKSPPKNAIQHSLQMLKENRIGEFRSSLTGAASHQMASDWAVDALKQKVNQMGDTELGNENVISSSTTPQGSSIVNYRVDVKANRDMVGTVDVLCRTDYSTSYDYVCENDDPPVYHDRDRDYDRDEPNPPRYDGRNDDRDNDSGRDRDRDSGHLIPGDSHGDKGSGGSDTERPPRFPGMTVFSQQSSQSFNQQWGRRCYNRPSTSSSTDCKVSQINL